MTGTGRAGARLKPTQNEAEPSLGCCQELVFWEMKTNNNNEKRQLKQNQVEPNANLKLRNS